MPLFNLTSSPTKLDSTLSFDEWLITESSVKSWLEEKDKLRFTLRLINVTLLSYLKIKGAPDEFKYWPNLIERLQSSMRNSGYRSIYSDFPKELDIELEQLYRGAIMFLMNKGLIDQYGKEFSGP